MSSPLKDTGKRISFEGGAVREPDTGRPRVSLIPPSSIARLGQHFTNGAEKYADHNWKRGIPYSRMLDSMHRHILAFEEGDTSEDHLAAIAWGAVCLMYFEDKKMTHLDDLVWKPENEKTV
jgi:hypothetical protein